MNQPVISFQDAHTFQLLFRRNGYEPPNSRIVNEYPDLLGRAKLQPIDKVSEVIISHLKIEQDKGGVVSFLKFAAVPVNNVSIFNAYGMDKDGKYIWRRGEGEIFITNCRIIMFCNSRLENSKDFDMAYEFGLGGIKRSMV